MTCKHDSKIGESNVPYKVTLQKRFYLLRPLAVLLCSRFYGEKVRLFFSDVHNLIFIKILSYFLLRIPVYVVVHSISKDACHMVGETSSHFKCVSPENQPYIH